MRECCLDSAARIIEDANCGREFLRQPQRGARQIELDHLGGTGADQEQQPDVRPPRDQLSHDTVQFVVGVGEPGKVLLFHDCSCESRLSEDHHASGGLNQMRAGARAHHQEERVLDLAMQPDDAGQPAEDLALATLATDRLWCVIRCDRTSLHMRIHARLPETEGAADDAIRSSRRAARSFNRNCVALTKYDAYAASASSICSRGPPIPANNAMR